METYSLLRIDRPWNVLFEFITNSLNNNNFISPPKTNKNLNINSTLDPFKAILPKLKDSREEKLDNFDKKC